MKKPSSNPKCKAIKRLASRLATPCQSPGHSRKRNRRWTQINANECENAYLRSLASIGGSKFLEHSLLVDQNDFAFFWTLAGPVRFRPRAIRLASRAHKVGRCPPALLILRPPAWMPDGSRIESRPTRRRGDAQRPAAGVGGGRDR